MTPEQAKALREPFKPEQIGKLPKPTKRDNPRGKCGECGGYHGLPAVHLDYVGHAAITDRLLQVDPDWTWEPMARDDRGGPLLDSRGGLWINLTVCGVTRPGYGDETNGKGMKEIVGDALRNAAMRFGVGLDLWSKERLQEDSAEEPSAPEGAAAAPQEPRDGSEKSFSAESSPFQPPERARDPHGYTESRADAPDDGGDPAKVRVHFGKNEGKRLEELTANSRKWYATDWQTARDPSPEDRRLRHAARILEGVSVDETAGTFARQAAEVA